MGTVELIVVLSGKFGVDIPPAEIDREQWASPRKIVAHTGERVGL
jgi:D-alanine--poly(phosphoribitol) ligase subunit 2